MEGVPREQDTHVDICMLLLMKNFKNIKKECAVILKIKFIPVQYLVFHL